MKKCLFILLGLILFNLPASAIITPEEGTSPEYVKNHGYSDEMCRLIDLQQAQINGKKTKFQKKEPKYYDNKYIKFIRHVNMYLDPSLDAGHFGKEQIDYTNRWDDL